MTPTAARPISVVIADDHPVVREGLQVLLSVQDDMSVAGAAADGAQAVALCEELQPDVLLLDLSMPGLDGLEAIPLLKDAAPGVGIIVFSGFAADRMRAPALALGADLYLEKGEPLDVIRDAVREVALAA